MTPNGYGNGDPPKLPPSFLLTDEQQRELQVNDEYVVDWRRRLRAIGWLRDEPEQPQ